MILRLREARVVERVDAPCIHGAVAEGRAHRVDRLGDQEYDIRVRDEVKRERDAAEGAADHERESAPQGVGECAGRDVGQERHHEVDGEDAVDLELIEPARPQEDRIDAGEESARQRVHE